MKILSLLFGVCLLAYSHGGAQTFTKVAYDELWEPGMYKDSVITSRNIGEYYAAHSEGIEKTVGTLSKLVRIEIIDKKTFEAKRPSEVNYLVADNIIKKTGGVITLPCRDSIVKFADNDVDEETRQEYQYLGQISFLKQFVIGGSYWETMDIQFIDKLTGRQTAIFEDYPFISPDKRHIVAIYANPYDTSADLSIDAINADGITSVLYASFKNWMPYMDQAFYSKDGWLYFPDNHSGRYWDTTGGLNGQYQYMRIKVL